MNLRKRQTILLQFLLMLLIGFLAIASPIHAQDGAAPAVGTVTPNDIKDVADELWCPLCSGVRLDACELKACEQMRDVISEKLTAGESKDAIKDYFIAQYGPQVMGEPPMEGFNWLAWILPVVALIGGGVFVWLRARGMIASKLTEPALPASETPNDPYQRQLDEELKKYG